MLGVLAVVVLLIGGGMLLVDRARTDDGPASASGSTPSTPDGTGSDGPVRDTSTTSEPETTTTTAPYDGWVNPSSAGQPYGDTVRGLLTFRGNPTRTYYGEGPVPTDPIVLWRYPASGGMCSESTTGGETSTWCGTGWTGQPAVFERDGRTMVAFGAYDRAVHLLDGETGEEILPPFPTGDIIKGSVTIDPDGFPLLYTGSRDNYYRVLALDRPGEMVELWKLSADAVSPVLWNNDWDGSGLVLDDYLFEGGENSQFHIVKLNRGYGPGGEVTVNPQLVFNAPGWDDQLLADVGDQQMSIENSVAISGNTVYFANSGGLVQGWDIAGVADGVAPTRVFRFWTGDDTDASIVVDEEGYLYVGVEYDRKTDRGREVGQLLKLDPRQPDNPLVWSIDDTEIGNEGDGGVWSTMALHDDIAIATTNAGRVLGIDRATGQIRWEKRLPGPVWQSPVVVDDVLLEGDCDGVLHAFDVSDTTVDPPPLWQVDVGGCVESTPAVWNGRIYVGTRNGQFVAIGDRP